MTARRLQTWLALAAEGFGSPEEWSAWALEELMITSPVPPWLVDLIEASSPDDALHAMGGLWRLIDDEPPLDGTELRLGVMYLACEHGAITLADALQRAGTLVDCTTQTPDPSEFYVILNDLEAGLSGVAERARALFAPFARIASAQLIEFGISAAVFQQKLILRPPGYLR